MARKGRNTSQTCGGGGAQHVCGGCSPVGPICNGQPQCAFGAYCAACGWAGWPMPNPVSSGLPNPAMYDTSTPCVVVDKVTGLMWQRAVDANSYTQGNAQTHCAGLTLAGHCDWRLPTRIELVSIVDTTVYNPSINGTAFPNTPDVAFWTSSPYAQSAGDAWYVSFDLGLTSGNYPASEIHRVRCVR